MVVISAVEVWKGVRVFYWPYSSGLSSDDVVKAALPIAVAALGLLEHIMSMIALYYCCCCRTHTAEVAHEVMTTTTTNMFHPQPQQHQMMSTYERPSCQPCASRQQLPPPRPACQPCAAKQTVYSAGGMGGGMNWGMGGGIGGGLGGGMGGGCSSCPRPSTYNYGPSTPNPAYNFYRS